MFGMPTVKVGLVGGQGYGKTVFLASLLELAHRDSGQCIRLCGSPNATTEKKYTKWLTEFRIDGGRISSTTELLNVNYVLGASGSSQWKLQFKDFRGEDLDGDIEIENRDDNSSQIGATPEKKEKSNVERDKEALKKWFDSCDVLIFLLPVNVVKHDALVGETDDVKSEKKLAILNAYVQQIKAKGKIACLALNKSDLVPDETTCEDLIRGVPAIGKFYHSLHSCFGAENVFCHKISAFGKHQKHAWLADAKAEPVGVAEMLADVVPRAEATRLERFFEGYKKVGEKPFFVRYAHVPQLFWGALKNAWRGIADADRRTTNFGMLKRCGRRFATECAIVLAAIWCGVLCGNVKSQNRQYAEIDTVLENGFSDAQQIVTIEAQMGEEPLLSAFNWNSLLLKNRRARLWERIRSEKLKFNEELAKNAENVWICYKDEIENWLNIAPGKRSNDVAVVRAAVTNALSKMSSDAIAQQDRVRQILGKLSDNERDIAWNRDIDSEFHKWRVIPNQIEKCQKASIFIKNFPEANYPNHVKLIQIVKQEKQKIENAEFELMTNALLQAKYADDYNEKTDGFADRIARCNERIRRIERLTDSLPDSEKNGECSRLIEKEKERIDYLNRYGKFDDAFKELQTHRGEKTYVKHVEKFLTDYPRGSYLKRQENLQKLEEFLQTDESALVNNTTEKIATEELSDSTNLLWQVRLERIEKRIEIVSNCLVRLLKQSENRKSMAEIINVDQELRREIERLREYYVAFDSTMAKEEEYRIKAINDFISRYGNNQYPNVPALYSEQQLIRERGKLQDEFSNRLEIAQRTYADDNSKDWTARKASARALREELSRYAVATGNDKDGEIKRLNEFVAQCDRNIEFSNKLDKIDYLNKGDVPKDLFAEIYSFYKTFPAHQWSSTRSNDYARVRKTEQDKITGLRERLENNLRQNDSRVSIDEAILSCKARIRLLEKHMENFIPLMDEYRKTEERIKAERMEENRLSKFKSLNEKIIALLIDGKSLDDSETANVATFLYGVAELTGNLSDSDTREPLIKNNYDEMIRLRNRFDEALESAMIKELDPVSAIIENRITTVEDRLKAQRAYISITEAYLRKLCPNGKIYPKVRRDYERIISDKQGYEDLKAIDDELKVLKEEIADTSSDAEAQLKRIDGFWRNVKARGGEEAFPSLRGEFGIIHSHQKAFLLKNRYEELRAKITNEFKGFQGDELKEKLDIYLSSAQRYKSELMEFTKDVQTSDDATAMLGVVGGYEGRIRTSLEGLRLWDEVENARTMYVRSPSASSYEKYENACKKYRTHPSIKKSEFEQSTKTYQQMEKDRKELVSAYEEFCKDPCVFRLNELIALKNKSPLLSTTSVYRFADECQMWQARGRQIKIDLSGYDFTGRFKCTSWAVDFFAEIRIGDQTCFKIERDGIEGDDRNSPDDLRRSGFSPHQISHDVFVPNVGLTVKVQFANKSGSNQWSGFSPITFIKILAWASKERGSVKVNFFDLRKNEDSKVAFSFSNLPYVEME